MAALIAGMMGIDRMAHTAAGGHTSPFKGYTKLDGGESIQSQRRLYSGGGKRLET